MFPGCGEDEVVNPDAASDAVEDRYRRFAEHEAPGRSALYEEWAAGVADDPQVRAILVAIAAQRLRYATGAGYRAVGPLYC